MNFLLIETSSTSCSVAVYAKNSIAIQLTYSDSMKHAEKLPLFIEECNSYAKANNIVYDAIAVSAGPGSYTGLRIGVSQAKGLCYGYRIPLIAIDTLKIITNKALRNTNITPDLICPMVDARRMEVYCCIFDTNYDTILEHQAKIVDEFSFTEILSNKKILFCGNGASKCIEIIKSKNSYFELAPELIAEDMVEIAIEMFKKNEFVDLAYYEPFYLKEFQSSLKK